MMKNKNISLPISFSVNNEISDKNNRFIDVTIDVLHTGLNYNGSIFNKEVVDEYIESRSIYLGFFESIEEAYINNLIFENNKNASKIGTKDVEIFYQLGTKNKDYKLNENTVFYSHIQALTEICRGNTPSRIRF